MSITTAVRRRSDDVLGDERLPRQRDVATVEWAFAHGAKPREDLVRFRAPCDTYQPWQRCRLEPGAARQQQIERIRGM